MLPKVLNARHVTRLLLHHKEGSILTDTIAILRVKITWKSTSTLVSEIMALWSEDTLVSTISFSLLELTHDSQDKKSFGINLGDLHVTVWVPVKKKLTRNGLWKGLEKLLVLWGECAQDVFLDLTLEFVCKDFIDFLDKNTHFWNEFNESLWHKDHTIVFTSIRSLTNHINNLLSDITKGLIFFEQLLLQSSSS